MLLLICAVTLFMILEAPSSSAQSFSPETSYHTDQRATPRQEFIKPDQGETRNQPMLTPRELISPDAYVRIFLQQNAARYGFDPDLNDLRQIEKQQSLLGTHYRFQQYFNDKEVIAGQIVVSIDKDGNITEISNNIYPTYNNKSDIDSEPKIPPDQALDIVWNDLHISQGTKLTDLPIAELKYFPEGSGFRLVYDIQISADPRIGSWEYAIAADTGQIVNKQTRAPNLNRFGEVEAPPHGPLADRVEAFSQYTRQQQAKRAISKRGSLSFPVRSDGRGLVFDPDPVTALKDDTITPSSPVAKFERAYTEVKLKDLAKENGAYHLDGPWVKIVDIEAPSTQGSTSADGVWRVKRGDNAFNDVMIYYHLDTAQRYLHSLGFTGLIARPIEADSNGCDGTDNSHHVPSQDGRSGYLAFGHGGVPDPEDASVIWHEHGHAVHAEIVGRNWSGGDSQMLGEGFGDYWAASHNLATANGGTYKRDRLFKWDIKGNDTPWGGRGVELTGYKYDPTRRYGRAHEGLDPVNTNSPETAELWSSPLFASLLDLVARGSKREEVDAIVVQSMYGLTTSGFSMRDVAQKVILTAQQLYPNGPHWKVLLTKFQDYNICPPNVMDSCPNREPAVAAKQLDNVDPAAKK